MTRAERRTESAGQLTYSSAPSPGPLWSTVESIVAVVPVHNEQTLLPACLAALSAAADRSPAPVRVVIVLDACTDASNGIASRHAQQDPRFTTVVVDRGCVGAARAAGCATIVPAPGVWLACTDADSAVPLHWFSVIARCGAVEGVDALAGTVAVARWKEHDAVTAARYADLYATPAGAAHGHVHGANMAVRSTAYDRVGGFAALRTGEDVDLMGRLRTAGHRIRWLGTWTVETSDRRRGRAPDGFADHLMSVAAERDVEAVES